MEHVPSSGWCGTCYVTHLSCTIFVHLKIKKNQVKFYVIGWAVKVILLYIHVGFNLSIWLREALAVIC